MMIGVFELFKIGIGPSSSHTMGPMRAANAFATTVAASGLLTRVDRVRVDLFGSLAWTGKGHGTDKAAMLGLSGESPDTVDPDAADAIVAGVREQQVLRFAGRSRTIAFDAAKDIVFDGLGDAPHHPNTLALSALDAQGNVLLSERWCSIGGGFVVRENEIGLLQPEVGGPQPYAFRSGRDLLALGIASGRTIAEMMMANEVIRRPASEVEAYLDRVAAVMMACIDRGMVTEGELPGGLSVRRRAPMMRRKLDGRNSVRPSSHEVMDWVSLYAIAVNEENAAGSRVVTAPTNGAAGIVPATLRYYRDHCAGANAQGERCFLLTASAIGALFKMNASISGAEVGCQGEVGVACSMAAAGLAAVLGGTNEQIENAAEIGMEHHLGMTCDPIGGLVQIPCIERNAFGAIKAINAASLALNGDGTHIVSLDKVIATMRETGRDMQSKYKETSLGGLAVNLAEC